MPESTSVAQHYTHGSLFAAISEGISALGKTVDTVNFDDLAPVEEFHIGGRVATESLLNQLDIVPSHHVLDVGCGLGGASRFAAHNYGCRITGVDLTQEYVDTGNIICRWFDLDNRINLETEDASHLPYANETFDRAYMLHVGMNIAEKQSLTDELYRVLRPGGRLGIYDVMRVGDGELTFPVPWASGPQGSAVDRIGTYKSALSGSGFKILTERNRRDFALEFFAQLQSQATSTSGPPPLGLHLLMGSTAAAKIGNMIENISRNIVAPVEIIAERPI
jgi:ubiquinone/menaquinone biosynthesis C-methylase UbiE